MPEYPSDDQEFAGLYGYNDTYSQAQFLHDSSKFFIFSSEFKGQHRIFLIDTTTRQTRMLKIPGVTNDDDLRVGDYMLMRIFEDTLVINYSTPAQPPKIFCLRFK